MNCLKGATLELYSKEISLNSPYEAVVDNPHEWYSAAYLQMAFQSKIDSLKLEDFMARSQIWYENEFSSQLVEHLNMLTLQLV